MGVSDSRKLKHGTSAKIRTQNGLSSWSKRCSDDHLEIEGNLRQIEDNLRSEGICLSGQVNQCYCDIYSVTSSYNETQLTNFCENRYTFFSYDPIIFKGNDRIDYAFSKMKFN